MSKLAKQMGPKASKATKAKEAARKVQEDSSDEEAQRDVNDAQARADDQRRRAAAKLNREKVLQTVVGLQQPNRLPGVFTEEVVAEWREWHANVPTTLEEIPEELRAGKLKMPMKCRPAGAAFVAGPPQTRTQVDIITYDNAGGSSLGRKEAQRAAEVKLVKSLVSDDVPVGSIVAIKADEYTADEADTTGGRNTPFAVADILEVELQPPPPSSSATSQLPAPTQPVARMLVHWRMPVLREKFVDDPQRPWKLACMCNLEWGSSHERRKACRERRAGESLAQETSKWVDWVDAERILETKLGLTANCNLLKETRTRIAGADKRLKGLLGLGPLPNSSGLTVPPLPAPIRGRGRRGRGGRGVGSRGVGKTRGRGRGG